MINGHEKQECPIYMSGNAPSVLGNDAIKEIGIVPNDPGNLIQNFISIRRSETCLFSVPLASRFWVNHWGTVTKIRVREKDWPKYSIQIISSGPPLLHCWVPAAIRKLKRQPHPFSGHAEIQKRPKFASAFLINLATLSKFKIAKFFISHFRGSLGLPGRPHQAEAYEASTFR